MKTGIAPLMAAVGIMAALCAAADVAVEKTATGFAVRSGDVRRTLDFYGPNTLRVKSDLGRDHWKHPSLAIVAKPSAVAAKLRETADAFVVEGAAFTVSIDRKTGALTFSDKGKVLLREPSDPCTIKEINIDGEPTYEVTQRWKLEDGEGLYGLGQAASGKFNLRGQKIKIVQTNIPAFSPVWSSSKGYMILWDVYSQSIFDDKADGLSLWGESAPGGSDWYFMYGADPDRRFAEYRMLTGAAPMFPKAAFGYFQSKERYKSAQELIDVVSRFRELGYPIDWIVQDWQYWDARDDRWNAMQWDKSRFPDPKGLCDTLHNDLHVKLITSIWPDVGDDTDVARELDSHKLRYAPGHWISKGKSHVYDAYSKLGREIYFKHLKKGLIDVGVDAMWMDGSELETRDACHNADKMVEQIKACGRNEMGDFTRYLNTYGLVTTMGNYEGQRATSDKRTFTLTRTAWAGLQRYAAIPWSGDTGASWGRLKDDIAGGLGASMSGLPYWTQDTGGFFCGHYGDAMNNPEFLELLARWNQFAIFNPVYRWHVSSPVAKEPFRAKEKHPEYYESFLSAARLRYRLLPYIYSLARDVHETGRPFVRPAWIDFPGTPGANDDQTSIVFGPSLYTSVITRPVYTGHTTGSGSPVPSEMLTTPDGKAGVKVEYFKGQDHKAKVSETVVAQVNDTWPGPPLVEWPEGLTGGDDFSARYTGKVTLSKPGTYELGIEGDDGFALWLDGEEKFRDWAKQAARSKATRVTVPEGGRTFDFRIDYFNDKFARSVKFWMRTPEEVAKLERESRKIEVALPVGADWYDFRTGEKFAGGTKLQREYPIDSFPLFVKAGSVLPLGPDVQYATEKTDKPIELRVYPGADASFTLYYDDNETYAYEKGAFEKIPLSWDDAKKALTIGAREGSYPGMPKTREFRIVCGTATKAVRYDGHLVVVDLAAANAGATGASALKPVMWADVPDVAPLRVGDTYYMVSTTMHFNPGVPVMASKDLVNWKTISYCYKTIEDRPQDRLENGASDYGLGTWASSIRYNEKDGFFYVTSFNNKVNSTYLFRTKDPTKSEWEFFRLSPKQYDESLWIEDGRFYVFATVPGRPYKVRLTEMKPDFSGFVDGGRIILDNVTDCAGGGGLGEGTQVFRRNGWCYIVNIGWPKGSCRCVIVHRSRSWDGPWEGRIVFEREGIAQGSFVDRPDGSWVAVLFGDRGAVGRIPYILETEWKDDWPVVQPREVKDASGSTGAKVPGCVASDEFDGGELGLQWQWNHNPDDANWSLSERRGFMRIKAGRVDGDLLQARNTLTQRTFGPACEGETCIDVSGLKEGDVAGLTLLQRLYGLAAVRVRGGKRELVLWSPDVVPTRDKQNVRINRAVRERQKVALPDGATKVWLKAVCDFTPGKDLVYSGIPASTDKGKFYYSFDGRGWTPFCDAFDLVYTMPHFIGYRFGLCCFSTSAEGVGGFADFDYLRVAPRDDAPFTSDGSNPIVKTRFSPDPAAVVDGDWLYVFSGRDEPDARGYTMRDWGVVRTKDLKNWEDLGPVMSPAVFKWALGNNRAWASQAIKRNGKWYWYVAVYGLDPRGDCIGVAVADRPEGPWSDPIGKPIVGPGAGYIDPSVFIDDDGKAYLFWGNCGGTPGCWYAELKENMVELASEVKPVPGLMEESAFGKPLKKARGAGARKPIDTNFEEAPWIYKLGDTYYLEYAAGGVPEYWAYSTAKSIHGPWKYGGKIMDCAEGTGTIHGGSVFFKGEWYMLYHNATLEGGADCRRSACIERYVRNPDGSIPFIPATKKGVAEQNVVDLGELPLNGPAFVYTAT